MMGWELREMGNINEIFGDLQVYEVEITPVETTNSLGNGQTGMYVRSKRKVMSKNILIEFYG